MDFCKFFFFFFCSFILISIVIQTLCGCSAMINTVASGFEGFFCFVLFLCGVYVVFMLCGLCSHSPKNMHIKVTGDPKLLTGVGVFFKTIHLFCLYS